MVAENTKILTAEQEAQLLQPIDEYVGAIQKKIDALRAEGTDKIIEIQDTIDTGKLNMFADCIGYDFTILRHSIHFHFLRMFDKLTYYHRMLL